MCVPKHVKQSYGRGGRCARCRACGGVHATVCLLCSVLSPTPYWPALMMLIHRKYERGGRAGGGEGGVTLGWMICSDRPSPVRRELSMSGRTARARQIVDEILNAAHCYHGSDAYKQEISGYLLVSCNKVCANKVN